MPRKWPKDAEVMARLLPPCTPAWAMYAARQAASEVVDSILPPVPQHESQPETGRSEAS